MSLHWLSVAAQLPDHEIRAFLIYARDIRPDFDTLNEEHARAIYEMYRQWERPDLPQLPAVTEPA